MLPLIKSYARAMLWALVIGFVIYNIALKMDSLKSAASAGFAITALLGKGNSSIQSWGGETSKEILDQHLFIFFSILSVFFAYLSVSSS